MDTARGWTAQALCVGADPEAFFPPGDAPAAEARDICAACPVRGQCLAYAVTADERFGIWGGLDPRQRAARGVRPGPFTAQGMNRALATGGMAARCRTTKLSRISLRFSVIVVMLILEVARPGGQRLTKALAAEIVASSVSFGIYFAIAGAVFLDDYKVPQYTFKDWQLLAGVPLGLFAALVVTLLAGFMMAAARLFGRLKVPAIAKSTLGGVVFGIVGVALPLTIFSGSNQPTTVLKDAGPASTCPSVASRRGVPTFRAGA